MISVLTSFSILGLLLSAPADLLLLMLVRTFCISKKICWSTKHADRVSRWAVPKKPWGLHFQDLYWTTGLSPTLEKYLFKLLQTSFVSVTTPPGTVRLVITVVRGVT